MEAQLQAVKHVGDRMVQPDTVCRTSTIWRGYGDVKMVDHDVAARLTKFPRVFVPATKQEYDQIQGDKVVVQEALKKRKAEVVEADVPEDSDEPPAPDAQHLSQASLEETTEAASMREIVTAISSLDKENPEHYTDQGRPRVAAVRIASGNKAISMADINKAWDQIEG